MATQQQIGHLREQLISVAKSTPCTVAYSEVDHLVGLNVRSPRDRRLLGEILSELGTKEIMHSRPYLPAVVVRKDTRIPGSRFYREILRHCPKYRSITDNRELHKTVLAQVVEYYRGSKSRDVI
jgi:hypothetical protein